MLNWLCAQLCFIWCHFSCRFQRLILIFIVNWTSHYLCIVPNQSVEYLDMNILCFLPLVATCLHACHNAVTQQGLCEQMVSAHRFTCQLKYNSKFSRKRLSWWMAVRLLCMLTSRIGSSFKYGHKMVAVNDGGKCISIPPPFAEE
jgi:hypothetical protein